MRQAVLSSGFDEARWHPWLYSVSVLALAALWLAMRAGGVTICVDWCSILTGERAGASIVAGQCVCADGAAASVLAEKLREVAEEAVEEAAALDTEEGLDPAL